MEQQVTGRELSTDVKQTQNVIRSLDCLFSDYDDKRKGVQKIHEFVRNKDGLINYFLSGNRVQRFMAAEIFTLDGAVAALNAEFWSLAINKTDVLECMPAAKRNEWSSMIHEMKTPEFNRENVIQTLTSLILQRGEFFTDRVDGLFKSLSGEHVTNSPMAFRQRLIIGYLLDSYGFINYRVCEYIHDLRVVIAKLSGRDPSDYGQTRTDLDYINRNKKFGEWFEFDGGLFKIRIYKKGTAHMEISPDMADRLNTILANKYPSVIAASTRVVKKQRKKVELRQESLPMSVLNVLCKIADEVNRGSLSGYISDAREIPSDVFEKVESVVGFLGGDIRNWSWYFPHDVTDTISLIVRTGCLPEKVSHQFYPTPDYLAKVMVDRAEIKPGHKVLEPSAGRGALADQIVDTPDIKVVCVEVSSVNASILKGKGYETLECDFLELEASGDYDRIIMNPPFAKGQALRHVSHAMNFLADGGRLVAIMPASHWGKIIDRGPQYVHHWGEELLGQFADTGVRVCILTIDKEN